MSARAATRLLGTHLRGHRRALGRLAAWSALEAAPVFLSGLLIAAALDHGFLAGRPMAGFGHLGVLAGLWGFAAWGTRRLYPWLAETIEPVRDSLLRAVVAASLRRALAEPGTVTGAAVSQAAEQVEAVRLLLSSVLRNMRQFASAGVAALGGLTVLAPLVGLIVAVCVAAAVIVFVLVIRVLLARFWRVILTAEGVAGAASPVLTGMRDVVSLAAEDRATADVGAAIEEQAAALRAYARARMLRIPVLVLGFYLPLVGLLALAPWLIEHQGMTIGAVVGGVTYLMTGLQMAITLLVESGSTLLVNLGVVLGRLAQVCAAEPQPGAQPDPQSGGRIPPGSHLEVDGVSFAYSSQAEPVIDNVSFELAEGAHLAVVGPSGVGKSTLANLLARLEAPQHGQLRVSGLALDDVDEQHLRRAVALIPQEAYVFGGSVHENLTYLSGPVEQARLEAAVAAVGLDVDRLGGFAGRIPPGAEGITPGQRQLIALARVYLSEAAVVILDEATCHLDPVAEARAELAFARRAGTLIVIAHRVSSARRAQRILVMDGFDTVAGGHEDLLSASPLYAELVGHWHGSPEQQVSPSYVGRHRAASDPDD